MTRGSQPATGLSPPGTVRSPTAHRLYDDPVAFILCLPHRAPAAAECLRCGRGLCPVCLEAGKICDRCRRDDRVRLDLAMEARRTRVAMRRAGLPARRHPGDPVVLWEGPFRLVLPGAGSLGLVFAVGVAVAILQEQFAVDPALSCVGLAWPVGWAVRQLFGGVSRAAGLAAALLVTVGHLYGRVVSHGVAAATTIAVLGRLSTWTGDHLAAELAAGIVAALIAYLGAAGRSLA